MILKYWIIPQIEKTLLIITSFTGYANSNKFNNELNFEIKNIEFSLLKGYYKKFATLYTSVRILTTFGAFAKRVMHTFDKQIHLYLMY